MTSSVPHRERADLPVRRERRLLVYGGVILVLRSRDYRRIFEQLDQLCSRGPHRRCRGRDSRCASQCRRVHRRLLHRLAACREGTRHPQPAVLRRDLYIAKLEPVIRDFALDVETVQDAGVTKLVFDPRPDRRFLILELLDDDYLLSTMTELRYEVNSNRVEGEAALVRALQRRRTARTGVRRASPSRAPSPRRAAACGTGRADPRAGWRRNRAWPNASTRLVREHAAATTFSDRSSRRRAVGASRRAAAVR